MEIKTIREAWVWAITLAIIEIGLIIFGINFDLVGLSPVIVFGGSCFLFLDVIIMVLLFFISMEDMKR
jgi:hypothetical protein